MATPRGWSPIAATVLALVVINVANNRLLPRWAYVPFCISMAIALVAFARRVDGRSWAELGLAREDLGSGLRWGGAILGTMVGLYLIAFVLPPTHDLFLDDRVRTMSTGSVLSSAFLRVPLGTVLLEEVAFRGVLLAQLAARVRRPVAIAMSSALFGLWHVLPSIGFESVNPVAEDTVGTLPSWVTVVGSVLFTAVAGVVFCWLRDRSRSLLAPMALHWGTNSLGYLFAWWAWRIA
jgi:membrane protease YdiL (CAAX protease family)